MFRLFKRKETVSKAEHEAIVAEWRRIVAEWRREARMFETAAAHFKRERDAARIEAAANAADATKHRASKANLKQFRTA